MSQSPEELRAAAILEASEAEPKTDPVTEQVAETVPSTVQRISASDLVGSDKDRPKADHEPKPVEPGKVNLDRPDDPTEGETKKRGRRKMTDEEKAAAKKLRDEFKAAHGRPDFSNVNGKPGIIGQPSRDYKAEAMEIFFPLSMAAGKWLGDHWAIEIDREKGAIKLTTEQAAYVNSMSRWLEYEQFPPMNPRYGFILATALYVAPKTKTDPTPERLKISWIRFTGWAGRVRDWFKGGSKKK